MSDQMNSVYKLKKAVIGNFLWMMGIVLCSQAFLQVKDPDYAGLLSGLDWWKSMQLWTALDPVQFSFFAAAIAFAMSGVAHFLYLSTYLFDFSTSKDHVQNAV